MNLVQPFEEHEINKIGPVISGSVICSNGKLTPKYEYIAKLREKNNTIIPGDFNSEKKVLVLGAGYVSSPVVDYLTRDESIGVTVASDLDAASKKVANT